jgi:hypothetical protein
MASDQDVSSDDAAEIKRAVAEVSKRMNQIRDQAKVILDDSPKPDNIVRCVQCGKNYLKGTRCPKCFVDWTIINDIRDYLENCTLSYPIVFPQPNLDGFDFHDCELEQFDFEVGKVIESGRRGIIGFPLDDDHYLMVEWIRHGG